MKKKVFDKLVERELKKFKNYVQSDFMTKFIGCPVRCSEKQRLKSPVKLLT